MCAATKKGARGRIRTQTSSFSHLDRSNDQTSILKRLVAIVKSSGAWKARSSKGGNRACGSVNALMCYCVFSAAARPSRGIRWAGPCSVEGAERAKRRTMSAAGARKLGERSDGGEGQSRGGREWPFYRS